MNKNSVGRESLRSKVVIIIVVVIVVVGTIKKEYTESKTGEFDRFLVKHYIKRLNYDYLIPRFGGKTLPYFYIFFLDFTLSPLLFVDVTLLL